MRSALGSVLIVALSALALVPRAEATIALSITSADPAFRNGISDYTVDCAMPLEVAVDLSGVTEARIGTGPWSSRDRDRTVGLIEGQALRISKRGPGQKTRRLFFRCLPQDFPQYEFTRLGEPRSNLYVFTPPSVPGFAIGHYVVLFDGWGTPLWWYAAPTPVLDAKLLPEGTIAWSLHQTGMAFGTDPELHYEVRRLSGAPVRNLQVQGGITDHHDLQVLSNGNYLMLSYRPRPGPIDTSPYNGDEEAAVIDGVIQEVTPKGERVFEWSTKDHIGLEETGRWWVTLSEPYDIVHINAVEPIPGSDDFLISLRNTDAVYRIDGTSGETLWKLGGTPTEDSLTVLQDPHGTRPLGAQHDVRWLGGSVISIHDNRTDYNESPRAVRYRIDPVARTATLIDSQEDPGALNSVCCGSARFWNGAWLVSWGGIPLIGEYFEGSPTFHLTLTGGFSYRAVPAYGNTSKAKLRWGMNQQVPPWSAQYDESAHEDAGLP